MYRNYRFLVLLCLVMGLATAVVCTLMKDAPMPYLPHSPQLAYETHMLACPECNRPLLDDKGGEHGICEVGFDLLIAAMKAEKELK